MRDRPTIQVTASPAGPPERNLLSKWLVVSVVVAGLIGGMGIAGYELLRTKPQAAVDAGRAKDRSIGATPVVANGPEEPAVDGNLVDDDGRTMWASPTRGRPLDLSYLPPGSQIIVAVRPAKLAAHGEGAKVLAALGPLGAAGVKFIESATLRPWGSINELLISLQPSGDGSWQIALVVHVDELIFREQFFNKLSSATRKPHARGQYWLSGDWAYFLPPTQNGQVLSIAPEALVEDVLAFDGNPPPLRRDMERLLAATDADRDVTVLFSPNSLFGDGQSMFQGDVARLREPLFWFLGDALSAAALSIDWNDDFFLELAATPTLDSQPGVVTRELAERVGEIPGLVEQYVLGLEPHDYGQRLVARFPAMVRTMAAYTRIGTEDERVLMRCYLPAAAGHNLLLGAELTLAETPGASGVVANTTSQNIAETTVQERLQRVMSLEIARDSLDAALEQLSQDIGLEIVVLGPDLQADGITRNQQLAIDLDARPAEEILVAILRAANPDKSATGPADLRQKLVYVVKPKSPGGPDAVVVTTRARAAERGDALPRAFESSE